MNNTNNNLQSHTPEELGAHFQDMVKGTYSDSIGMEVLKYEPGYSLCRLTIKPEFLNPLGSLHGGLLFTIADTAAGIASVDLNAKSSVTTVSANIQYLRPALNLKEVYAEAKMVKNGKRIVFTDVDIMDSEKNVLCKGSFTYSRIVLSL